MKKKNIFFILSSLLIFFAVLALIAFIGFAGLRQVDLANRDTRRKAVASQVNTAIVSFHATNATYPDSIDLRFELKINDQTPEFQLELDKLTRFNINNEKQSNEIGTIYCYKKFEDGYAFGVKLESGQWFNLGTSQCSDEQVVTKYGKIS